MNPSIKDNPLLDSRVIHHSPNNHMMMTPSISKREKEVLFLVAYEHTAQEIASKLYISNHTAISHRKNLMEKLDVKNTAGLVRRAFELGILSFQQTKA